jgi:hypothetical protein
MGVDSGQAFTLLIESGLHAGVVQRLTPGIYTLGSELEADIVLSDAAVQPLHLMLELDRHGLRLEPLKGSVTIDGESASLEPGGERHLALPAAFTVGDARIQVTAPADLVRDTKRKRMAAAAMGLAVVGVVGLYTFGPLADAVTVADPTTMAMTDQTGPTRSDDGMMATAALDQGDNVLEAPTQDVAAAHIPKVDMDQAAAQLRERLAAASLADIDVIHAGDRLIAKGSAEPSKMSDWQSVQMWFDGAFAGDVLLVANVEPAEKEEPPKLAIEAVWTGDEPYLMAGGRRFYQGASVGDGWTVERIGTDEIILRRGDQSFSLTL